MAPLLLRHDSPIVDVQASASSLFARAGGIRSDDELFETVDRTAQTTVATQRDDQLQGHVLAPR